MSSHATVEILSAYIDRELPDAEARQIEQHLEDCDVCQQRFSSMRSVVAGLQHLSRLAPPSTLDQVVARRVAFEGREQSLVDRLESSMRGFERQSSLLALFGVVIAFAVMILLFAQALERHRSSTIPVVFKDPLSQRGAEDSSRESTTQQNRELAGRTFYLRGDVWMEEGIRPDFVRTVAFDSPLWTSLISQYPELAQLKELNGPVIAVVGHEGALRFERDAGK